MAGFDYHVVILGSRFGGALLRSVPRRRATGSASWNPVGAVRMRTVPAQPEAEMDGIQS
jgi:hypothetical protein